MTDPATATLARRARIETLVRQGTDAKLLQGSAARAEHLLEEAKGIAHEEPKRLRPWIALTAYRLGHLAMRRARTKDDLLTAEAYFLEAKSNDAEFMLGPVPHILRLPVLHRLRALADGPAEAEDLERRIAAGLERAREASAASGREGWRSRAPRQGELLNLLELCTYFLGAEYAPLEGFQDPFEALSLPGAWLLAGMGLSYATARRRPRGFVEAELKALEPAGAPVLRFVLPADETEPATLWMPEERPTRVEARSTRWRALRLIAHVWSGTCRTAEGYRDAVVGQEGKVNYVRTRILPKARALLARACAVAPRDAIAGDLAGAGLRLAPGTRFLAAVARDVFRRPVTDAVR
jgi:hypothetical protein